MIITIKGADFSLANIGTLGSFLVRYMGNVIENISTVEKNAEGTAAKAELVSTITMRTGYKYESLSITVNGVDVTGYNVVNNEDGTITLTIPAELITGTVVVSVMTTNDQGEDEEGTIELYSFDINATPKVAKVTLSADGYTQSGNSIQVPFGTEVAWTVESLGFTTQSGAETIIKDASQDIELTSADETCAILTVYGLPEGGTTTFTPTGTTTKAKDNTTFVAGNLSGRCYWGYTKDGYEPMGDVTDIKVPITNVETTLTELPIVTVIRELDLTTEATTVDGYFVSSAGTTGTFNGYYPNFKHLQIPVQPGQKYRVTVMTGQNAWPILFCATLPDTSGVDFTSHPAGNTMPKYTLLTERKKYAGPPVLGTYIMEVPENAQYMIVNSQTSTSANNALKVELIN